MLCKPLPLPLWNKFSISSPAKFLFTCIKHKGIPISCRQWKQGVVNGEWVSIVARLSRRVAISTFNRAYINCTLIGVLAWHKHHGVSNHNQIYALFGSFFKLMTKEILKAKHYWSFLRESTALKWPPTKNPVMGKAFPPNDVIMGIVYVWQKTMGHYTTMYGLINCPVLYVCFFFNLLL